MLCSRRALRPASTRVNPCVEAVTCCTRESPSPLKPVSVIETNVESADFIVTPSYLFEAQKRPYSQVLPESGGARQRYRNLRQAARPRSQDLAGRTIRPQ